MKQTSDIFFAPIVSALERFYCISQNFVPSDTSEEEQIYSKMQLSSLKKFSSTEFQLGWAIVENPPLSSGIIVKIFRIQALRWKPKPTLTA